MHVLDVFFHGPAHIAVTRRDECQTLDGFTVSCM